MSDGGTDIAVYALYAASPDELKAISTACMKTSAKPAYGGNTSQYMVPAPQPQHPTVDAVVEYHRALDKAGKWDPNYFAIAETPEWREKGILAVTLSKYDFEDTGDDREDDARARGYDTHRFKPSAIGIMFINLQIANMDWVEHKDWDDVQAGAPSSDDEEDDGEGDVDDE
ncbi:hypothetical protein BD309DRAFT_960231 [Dichomitus squalens]|uniref:Uncharacterized protein n=1 Tax=Dichomitus squalens TaxID=114155 RepID=A0A4Q9QAC4_9APHY|nr:uncharacterized protein DICSQDRAFT_166159 [Dichomitus squalens LYAD-421 SS1]EJF65108.1 hypothetical protein DICSQDRAFT_166159 [Dichomitus squalens LYAD-421 SS1]TBU29568.1 hypothetical protein BD311DRAFT_756382 [Dichomitus squalens]TBU43650.1 hypothetical protein BD309DRAFT_960231 [Dichomitus squalens]TBU64539.1 hypothetical protein BD310DRAFT_914824 [Dichomitus squalens]